MLAYDYVIVGGGTAGCVIAARLAKLLPEAKIALFEAGPSDENNRSLLDIHQWTSLDNSPNELSLDNIHQAKVLGGSSSINSGIAFLMPEHDTELWQQLGATSWEQTHIDNAFKTISEHVHLETTQFQNALVSAFVHASKSYGLPHTDFILPFDGGVGYLYLNKKEQLRQSSSVSFLHPLEALPNNLTVYCDSPVRHVVTHNGRAVGIETDRGTYLATQEIILSAGAINTPKLLMLSGIGPAQHLRYHDIELIHDLPGVGENLLDHPQSTLCWQLNRPQPSGTSQYQEAAAFIKTQSSSPYPEIMIQMVLERAEGCRSFSLMPMVTHAKSQGTVRLRDAEHESAPVIDCRHYSDPNGYDLQTMIMGIQAARDIVSQPALADWVEAELQPGSQMVDEESLAQSILQANQSASHLAGTCKLGLPSDPLAVVDEQFRVYGLDGLRVVDASVFPAMIGVDPTLSVMMLAELATQHIHHTVQNRVAPSIELDLL